MTLMTNPVVASVPTSGVAGRAGVSAPQAVPAATAPASGRQSAEALSAAVAAVQEQYANSPVDLHFSIDKQTNLTVIEVVDRDNGEVLRQIPSEELLHIARVLSSARGGLINGAA